MNKRGLSEVVTTIIIILLILIAIAGIWAVLNGTIFSQTKKISLDKLTINLKIKSVNMDYEGNKTSVRVLREVGEGNLAGIKLIVRDKDSSEVFDMEVSEFLELAERTFVLDLSTRPDLNIYEVYEVSVAPIILLPDSTTQIGRITDTIKGLAENSPGASSSNTNGGGQGAECSVASQCGQDEWITNTIGCYPLPNDPKKVYAYKTIWECNLLKCNSYSELQVYQTCEDNKICSNGECVLENKECASNSDCPSSEIIGDLFCKNINQRWQTNRTWYCNTDSICNYTDTEQFYNTCPPNQECETTTQGALCSPECLEHSDCESGEVCLGGQCIDEIPLVGGTSSGSSTATVSQTWAPNLGSVEYFSSGNLGSGISIQENYFVKFYSGPETRCLKIREYSYTANNFYYIRLNVTDGNISSGDQFKVWQTDWGCTQ